MFLLVGGVFILGGFFGGLALSILYVVRLVRHLHRTPWSYSLGAGWLPCLPGFLLKVWSRFTPQQEYSWQDGWANGLMSIGFILWWIALIGFFVESQRPQAEAEVEARRREQQSQDVWTPPR